MPLRFCPRKLRNTYLDLSNCHRRSSASNVHSRQPSSRTRRSPAVSSGDAPIPTTRDITGYAVGDVLFLFGFIPEWLLTNWEGVGEVWRIQAAGGWDLVAVGVRAQFPAALEN